MLFMKDLYRLFEMITRLEEAHQITFHQRYINFLMIEVYKYLNGHSPDIMNDIFKLRENTYFSESSTSSRQKILVHWNTDSMLFHICVSQLWQQVPTDIREAASLTLFKNRFKIWKCEDCPCRSSKIFVGYIWLGPISNWS